MSDEIANDAAPVADVASTAAPEAPAPAPAQEAPAPTMRETMAAVLRKTPKQGDDGRFESRAPATETAAPAAPEITDQPETQATETAETPSIEPPSSWSADVKAKWATLPPDVQKYIAQREGEAHQAITSTGAKLKGYEALEQVIGPRRQALAATWGNEAAAVQQLFQLSDYATKDPAGFVQWFAEQNRVDLSRLSAPANPASADPQVAALQRELQTLKSSLSQQQMTQTDAEIRSFATAKAADGTPLRPHFDDVRVEMGRLMTAGIAETLDDAYAKAVRTNDAVWAKVQASEAEARAKAEADKQAKLREQQAKAAAEAKRAASVNLRSIGAVSGSPTKPGSMRETMTAVLRQARGAA